MKNSKCLFFEVLGLLAFLSGQACAGIGSGTVFYWSFDGLLGAEIISDTDKVSAVTVEKFKAGNNPPGSEYDVAYGAANPWFSTWGTSADFANNPTDREVGAGLSALDEGVDTPLDLSTLSQFTIEAFIYPYALRQSVIIRKYGGNGLYYLDLRADGEVRFAINSDPNYAGAGPGAVEPNEWYHVAGVFDVNDAAAPMKIYINGELAGSAGFSDLVIDSTRRLGIGCIVRHNEPTGEGGSTGQFFHGRIDEIRISNVAIHDWNGWATSVGFDSVSSSNLENSSPAVIHVDLRTYTHETVTVDYTVTGGTATLGQDYILETGTLVFENPELLITTKTISVDIIDDDLLEDNETIFVTLSNPVNAVLGTSVHTLTIIDNDWPPIVEFESTESANPENVTPANITVKLSEPFGNTVTVDYAVTGGTATRHVDYMLADGALVFEPSQTCGDITIDIVADQLSEGDETIELTLSNPVNAVLGDNTQHIYTIGDSLLNSIGMEFVQIQPGTFIMGSESGDFDERPVHNVTIAQPFYISKFEVTNAQYEQFDPNHGLIDHRGFAHEPDEAVIFVSWEDANAFCSWLSDLESLPYRLPTEAEWEYACRAGTTARYFTGDTLDSSYYNERNQSNTTGPKPQALHVGTALPNPFGLHDMHGNVEEWCYDWYGPYDANDQTDPLGTVDTGVKVTRGGSHSTPTYFLRSSNRMGTTPGDKHWLIGFRVVITPLPPTDPLPVPLQTYQKDVSQQIPPDINDGPDPSVPYFHGPRRYVNIPPELDGGPLYTNHNHVPGIVECPNGDLLAIWYSTKGERDRLLNVAASRLRYGHDQWEEASVFWNAPDRNDHCPQLWLDEPTGTIYHFNGLADAYSWSYLATVMRTSTDNGVTWSEPRLIMPEHAYRHMPIETVFRASNGSIILPCDAVPGGGGGTALWISPDNGLTWYDPGSNIAGIHAGVAELTDGRLLAFGRGDSIAGMMPQSISSDMGQTWTYSPSPFPPIGGGKRLVLIRLREGPLFFASFGPNGLFGCISYDDGDTWTPWRLITDDGPGTPVETMDGSIFNMSIDNAEPRGYLSVHQARNGVIHLISSRQHYAFNLKYIDNNHTPCIVDFADLARFTEQWLATGSGLNADLDESGAVDFVDYGIFADHWSDSCPDGWR